MSQLERKQHLQDIYNEIHRAIEARVGRFLIGNRLNLAAPTVGTLPPTAGGTGTTSGVTIRGATDYDDTTPPATGQAITWNGSKYHPATVSGGGGAVSSGTLASRPAAGTVGALYLPTDAPYLDEDNGATWDAWGPIRKLTPPVAANWSWQNQGAATLNNSNGGLTISAPWNSGNAARLQARATPATPYTAVFLLNAITVQANYTSYGVYWYDSGSGKALAFIVDTASGTPTVRGQQHNSLNNGFNAQLFAAVMIPAPLWFRLRDDGTTRYYDTSHNGYDWVTLYSEARTTWITPTQLAFGCNAPTTNVVGGTSQVTLLSYAVS